MSFLCHDLENKHGKSSSHNRQNARRESEKREAHHHSIRDGLDQAMQNARANISPGKNRVGSINLATTGNRQRQCNRVELGWLLEKMVIVISLPARSGRQLRIYLALGGLARRFDSVVGRDSHSVHPNFHDQGPAIEGGDGSQKAGSSDA